jgi:hypothetical protein
MTETCERGAGMSGACAGPRSARSCAAESMVCNAKTFGGLCAREWPHDGDHTSREDK